MKNKKKIIIVDNLFLLVIITKLIDAENGNTFLIPSMAIMFFIKNHSIKF